MDIGGDSSEEYEEKMEEQRELSNLLLDELKEKSPSLWELVSDNLSDYIYQKYPHLRKKISTEIKHFLDEKIYNILLRNSTNLLSLRQNQRETVIRNLFYFNEAYLSLGVFPEEELSEDDLERTIDFSMAFRGSKIREETKRLLYLSSPNIFGEVCDFLTENREFLESKQPILKNYIHFLSRVPPPEDFLPFSKVLEKINVDPLITLFKGYINARPDLLERISDMFREEELHSDRLKNRNLMYEEIPQIFSFMQSNHYTPGEFLSFLEEYMGGQKKIQSNRSTSFLYWDKRTDKGIVIEDFDIKINRKILYGLQQLHAGREGFESLDDIAEILHPEYLIIEAESVPNIKVLKVLGRGIYKTTYLADYRGSHKSRLVALKRIELSERAEEKLRKRNLTLDDLFDKEISVSPLWFPPHPNINPLFPIESKNPLNPMFVETLYGETLEQLKEIYPEESYVEKAQRCGEITLFSLAFIGMHLMGRMVEMTRAIGLCHYHGLIHGDIKPGNIGIIWRELQPVPDITHFPAMPEFGIEQRHVVRKNPDKKPYKLPIAVVSDFGISSFIAETEGIEKVRDNIGSTYTRDPALFEKGSLPSQLSDVWSLTAIMYWMLTGKYPFSEEKEDYTLMETKQKYERRVKDLMYKGKINEALKENIEREIINDGLDIKKKLVNILSKGFRLVDNYYKNAIQMGQDIEAKYPYNDSFYNPVPTDYEILFSS